MRILELNLENFQGIRKASFPFDGCSASIYGDNATGKTTVFNAVTWLLFDQASTGAKGFTPKTDGPDGELHHLDHMAEARIALDSGQVVTLCKIYHENYKKKRGSATEEFSGHGTDYYLDGIPVKEKEYTAALQQYCGGAERMKLLTMPDYFSETLSWEDRRRLLLEVCGDVTDGDIITANPALSALPDFLRKPGTENQYYTVDEYRKEAASREAKINKELEQVPVKIAEAERAIPDVGTATVERTAANIASLESRIAKLTEDRAAAAAGTTAGAEIRRTIADLRTQIAQGRARYAEEQGGILAAWNAELSQAQTGADGLRRAKDSAVADLEQARMKWERLNQARERLVAEYKESATQQWTDDNAICPTCGQPFPPDRAEQMKADFNQRRSERLEALNRRGQAECSKSMISDCDAEITRLESLVQQKTDLLEKALAEIQAIQDRKPQSPFYENAPDYQALTRQMETLEKRLGNQGQAVQEAVAAVDEQLRAARNALRLEQEKQSNLTTAQAQRERIAELEAREKQLSAEYEKIEQGIYLCKLFIKAKVRTLTDRINNKFRSVRFRLFVDQVNGGVKDDCEVLVPSADGSLVPYRDANNAARINAGLEIIEALSNHWNTYMPVFIDNAESVTRLVQTETQTIRLVVSEPDKELRMEFETAA